MKFFHGGPTSPRQEIPRVGENEAFLGDTVTTSELKDAARTVLVLSGDRPGWQEEGLCAQTDPEVFYPKKGESTREAKKVCMSCVVRLECLDYAINNNEGDGIWGGMSSSQRLREKRNRDAI